MEPFIIYAVGVGCALVVGAVAGAQMAYRSLGYSYERTFYFVRAYIRHVIRDHCF